MAMMLSLTPPPKPQSCLEVIHEMYLLKIDLTPLLDVIVQFERTAMELEVYD